MANLPACSIIISIDRTHDTQVEERYLMIPKIDSVVEFTERSVTRSAIFSDGTALFLTNTYNLSEDQFGEPVYAIVWFNASHEEVPTPDWAKDLTGDNLDALLGDVDAYDNRYAEFAKHVGHEVEVVIYGDYQNVSLECNDPCGEVIIDYERPLGVPTGE